MKSTGQIVALPNINTAGFGFEPDVKSNSIVFGLVSSAIGTIGSVGTAVATGGLNTITGAAISGGVSAQNSIFSTIGQIKDAKNVPDQVYGQVGTSALRLINNKLGYTFYDMGTDGETIQSIDTYFTMFGYAVHRLKKPNRNSRPHWNYVKTIGATVTGSVPADDMRKICNIYDNGITTWKSLSEVYNYDLDNHAGIPTER